MAGAGDSRRPHIPANLQHRISTFLLTQYLAKEFKHIVYLYIELCTMPEMAI